MDANHCQSGAPRRHHVKLTALATYDTGANPPENPQAGRDALKYFSNAKRTFSADPGIKKRLLNDGIGQIIGILLITGEKSSTNSYEIFEGWNPVRF